MSLTEDYEFRLQQALKHLSLHPEKSLRSTATQYGCNHVTLWGRKVAGVKSRREAHVNEQVLSPAEEKALVQWALALDDRGIPPIPKLLIAKANAILKNGGVLGTWTVVGRHWIYRFLKRHSILRIQKAKRRDIKRQAASNPKILEHHFNNWKKTVEKFHVTAHDIWNMDETGFELGVSPSTKVITRRAQTHVKLLHDGNREHISDIECISAAGKAIPPFVIYVGKNHYVGWYRIGHEVGMKGAHYAYSEKGYINAELALEWLKKLFEPSTRPRNPNAYRILLCDSLKAHEDFPFLEFAIKHRILVVTLPAHTTHFTQPCDVGLFGPLKRSYHQGLNEWTACGFSALTKADFCPLLKRAREEAVRPEIIASAWEGAGLIPYNRRKVLDHLLVPESNVVEEDGPQTPKNSHQARSLVRKATALIGQTGAEAAVAQLLSKLGNGIEEAQAANNIQDHQMGMMQAQMDRQGIRHKSRARLPCTPAHRGISYTDEEVNRRGIRWVEDQKEKAKQEKAKEDRKRKAAEKANAPKKLPKPRKQYRSASRVQESDLDSEPDMFQDILCSELPAPSTAGASLASPQKPITPPQRSRRAQTHVPYSMVTRSKGGC